MNKYCNKENRGQYKKHYEYNEFIPYCNVDIEVKYLDSKHERMIQLADIVAISKYKRFGGKKGCHSDLLNAKVCLKLPDSVTFQSPKSVVYKI